MIGRKHPGMACQLFNAEQLGSQRWLSRAWVSARNVGHPVLNAQWQCLHGVNTFKRISAIFGRRNPAIGIPAIQPVNCARSE
jgi:hypothetical protein